METNSEVIAETPDMDYNEDSAEQETPDLNFSEIAFEQQRINAIDANTDTINKSWEHFTANDSDIDDLDEPDQYVEGDNDADETNQETNNQNHSESGLE